MIAHLRGTILTQRKNTIIIDVQGVGYAVSVPLTRLEHMTPGQTVALYTHQYIREDTIDLYGFIELSELELFERLISVSGIGPKAGLALLSQFTADALTQSIMQGDTSLLTKVSGIGKKTAERLILELKGSLSEAVITVTSGTTAEVIQALEQLGYSKQEIVQCMQHIDHALPVEGQIKAALHLLGK